MKKWEWIACCFILPIPLVILNKIRLKREEKKQSVVNTGKKRKEISEKKMKVLDMEFFNKYTKNTLKEARLQINTEVIKELEELKARTFDKIYELQRKPMRDVDRETLVKEFLQEELLKSPNLKGYLDNGLINADFIALHPNFLMDKAKKLFRNKVIKGYLLYNVDINHPSFSIKPMAYLSKVYITSDTKELFLLDKTIGVYLGQPMWYVVRGYPFSMEMNHCVEEIREEFEEIARIDRRFVLKREGLDSSDIALKFNSIELQKEIGYRPPTVERIAIAVISAIMTALITSMFWMMHVMSLPAPE